METQLNSKSFSLKHRLENSDDSNPAKRLRSESDIVVNSNNNNNTKLSIIKNKNPIQQLNEIKNVQPLSYEMISEEGLPHKRNRHTLI